MAEQPKNQYPLIAILGIDPSKHELPPLLHHHLSKIAKDMPVVFWAEEDMNEETWKSIRDLVKKTGFVPKLKQRVQPPSQILSPQKPPGRIITP